MHPGDIIAGKYRVANVLGRGRGLLLEARHTEFDQRVVIRLLSPHMCDEKQLEQFRREARTLSKLESEHVARIIDVGTHSDGSFFFVRQYLDGIDIGTHIRSQGALRLEEAVLYILQAAEAVQETHSHNIVLRELQPSHLFLTRRRGGAPLVKITDFGTAKVLKDPAAQVVDGEMTATVMFGMSQYSSPELVRKAKDIDSRTDVWSLGCILYEMLTAMTPFQGEMAELMLKITREEPIPLSNLRPDLPQEIDQIMGWALAKDRNARFSSVYAFAHALKPYASPEGQVLIDQIGRLAHAKNDDQSSGQISPTSPLAKRRGMPDDEDRTVIRQVPGYPGPAGAGEHDFERTQFMGNGPGSVPPPPGSVPGSQPGRGSVPPPAMGSHPGSVPPPSMGSHPGSVPPPAIGSHPAAAAVPAQRAPQGSWVEADPAAPSGVAAASQPYGAAPKKKNRGLVIALGAALVLLPVAVVAGILAMRSGGDEVAQADTSSETQGEPAPPLNEDAGDEKPTATDDGADTSSEGGDKATDAGDEDGGDEDGGEEDGGDDGTDENGGDEPEPKTAEAPTPTPTPKSLAPQPPTAPKPVTQPVTSTKKKKKKKTTKKKPPPAPESGGTGTLVAIAIGGSCSFAVDGAPRGTKSSIRIKVPVGRHTVSCTPPKGATRTQSVNVKSGKPGIASFRLN